MKEIGLICNHTSCPLGIHLHSALSTQIATVGVAHNATSHVTSSAQSELADNDTPKFDAFLNE